MSDFTRLQKRHVHTYRQAKVVNIKWHWNSSMAIAIGNAKHCKISLNCWYFFLASSWQLGAGKKTQNCIKLHWEVFINSSNCCHILSFNCRSLSAIWQPIRLAFWIIFICFITGEETNLRYSKQFIAALTEMTFKQIG